MPAHREDRRSILAAAQARAACSLVLPAGLTGRGQEPVSGLGRDMLARIQQLGGDSCGEMRLVTFDLQDLSLRSLDTGRVLSPAELFQGKLTAVLANPAFVLELHPPLDELVEAACREGLAVYGSDSNGNLYAAAVHHLCMTHDDFRRALAHLVARAIPEVRQGWAGRRHVAYLPSHEGKLAPTPVPGFPQPSCPPAANAPVYLNAAIAEVMYAPAAPASVGRAPEPMRQALLAQRERSAVPWIFNALVNAIEHHAARPVLDSFPPEIHLSTTGRCNIECRFCSYAHGKTHSNYVDVDRIARLDFFRHLHTLRLSSGLGEPTMNPHLPAMIAYLAEQYPQIALNFFTNGTTLGRRGLIDALVHKVAWMNVSLNAATAATWEELCERDLFDRLTGGLKELAQAKRARGALQPVVYGSTVLTSKNLSELPRMPALCRSLGVDRFTAIPFFAYAYDDATTKYGPNESFHRHRPAYEAVYAETVREAEAHGVSIELPLPAEERRATFGIEVRGYYDFAGLQEAPRPISRLVDHLEYEACGAAPCPALWRSAHIGSTDRGHASETATHFLYPCLGPLGTVDFSQKTAFDFPDARRFLELWNNPVFVRLRTAQSQRGVSRVCDACRGMDSRDPDNFADLDTLLREWKEQPTLIRARELTLRRA